MQRSIFARNAGLKTTELMLCYHNPEDLRKSPHTEPGKHLTALCPLEKSSGSFPPSPDISGDHHIVVKAVKSTPPPAAGLRRSNSERRAPLRDVSTVIIP